MGIGNPVVTSGVVREPTRHHTHNAIRSMSRVPEFFFAQFRLRNELVGTCFMQPPNRCDTDVGLSVLPGDVLIPPLHDAPWHVRGTRVSGQVALADPLGVIFAKVSRAVPG